MNRLLDKYLGSTAFLRQAPDNPSGGGGDVSGSSSAPASPASPPSAEAVPAGTPDSSGTADSGDYGKDFSMFFEGDGEPPPAPLEPAPAAPQPTPAPEAPKPQPAPATPPVPPVAPVPPQPAAAQPVPPVAPAPAAPEPAQPAAAPPLNPQDPGSLARYLAENKDAMIEQVATNLFKLSPKDMEDLENDLPNAIPKLLGRAFVTAQQNFLTHMSNLVPHMIQSMSEIQRRNTENEGKFLKAWPALNENHLPTVRQMASQYRQMHPQATFDQMVADLGPLVMMAARVAPTTAPPAPAAPAAPKPQPFVPAQTGPTAVPVATVNDDPWGLSPENQTG